MSPLFAANTSRTESKLLYWAVRVAAASHNPSHQSCTLISDRFSQAAGILPRPTGVLATTTAAALHWSLMEFCHFWSVDVAQAHQKAEARCIAVILKLAL